MSVREGLPLSLESVQTDSCASPEQSSPGKGLQNPGPSPTHFLLQIRKPRLLPPRSQQGLSPTAELASYQAQGGCHGPQLGITVDPREGHRGPPFPLGTCACWLRPQGPLQALLNL